MAQDNVAFVVDSMGGGDGRTVGEALVRCAQKCVLEAEAVDLRIDIRPGTYAEKLHTTCTHLHVVGAGVEQTTLTASDCAEQVLPSGEKRGTFRTQTLFVGGSDVTFENLTIQNDAGAGVEVGQAIALYADGDRLLFRNCHIRGHQDTLFIGPLPPAPIKPDGFRGPREFAKRTVGRICFDRCTIVGDVDFIFGSGTAVFHQCTIYALKRQDGLGYVAAPSTPSASKVGFLFVDCHLTGDADEGSVYLARPWREHAAARFLSCQMDAHIHADKWCDWEQRLQKGDVRFSECGTVLASEALAEARAALAGEDGWQPI